MTNKEKTNKMKKDIEENSIKELEKRIEDLEFIVSAIVNYRFPDGNSNSMGGRFTLAYELGGRNAYTKNEKVSKAIDNLPSIK